MTQPSKAVSSPASAAQPAPARPAGLGSPAQQLELSFEATVLVKDFDSPQLSGRRENAAGEVDGPSQIVHTRAALPMSDAVAVAGALRRDLAKEEGLSESPPTAPVPFELATYSDASQPNSDTTRQPSNHHPPSSAVFATSPAVEVDLSSSSNEKIARSLSLDLYGHQGERVRVEIQQLGKGLTVRVHASDKPLAAELRTELFELVRTIEQQGYQIEAWTPPETDPRLAPELTSASNQHRQPEGEQAPLWTVRRRGNRSLWLREITAFLK
jgi:hypothetical protein